MKRRSFLAGLIGAAFTPSLPANPLLASIEACVAALDAMDVPGEGRWVVVHEDWGVSLAEQVAPHQAVMNGYMGRIDGFRIITSRL